MASDGFGHKTGLWMPLDIGGWRRDTAHLNPTEKAAYLALRLYYWEHGSLPKDRARLASVAQLSVDDLEVMLQALQQAEPSIALFEDSAGSVHLAVDADKRASFALKRQKAREKAVKAANTRWREYRAKLRAQSDAPSIEQALPEQNSADSLERLSVKLEKQKQRGSLRSPLPSGAGAPRGGSTRPPSSSGSWGPKGAGSKSVNKAKRQNLASRTASPTTGKGNGHSGNGTSATGSAARRMRPSINGSRPQNGHHLAPAEKSKGKANERDPRFEPFKDEIFAYWAAQNLGDPKAGSCPWQVKDQAALEGLLRAAPEMQLETFKALLVNRGQSEVLPADPPRNWLGVDLKRYGVGPLDRYKQPVKLARTM